MEEKRTYKETYFYVFILCIFLTLISDHYSISVEQMTAYADGVLKRTFKNANILIVWVVPVLLMIKREVAMWRQSTHEIRMKTLEIGAKNEVPKQ